MKSGRSNPNLMLKKPTKIMFEQAGAPFLLTTERAKSRQRGINYICAPEP